MLPTCLANLRFSGKDQPTATSPDISNLYFAVGPGPTRGYPCFACAPYTSANKEETAAGHLVLSLLDRD